MSEGIRNFLFVCAALIVIYAALCFAGCQNNQITENRYDINDAFEGIQIDVIGADVSILPTEENTAKVVCFEKEKVMHSVYVQDGALHISAVDTRAWYNHISPFSFKTPAITVYLPNQIYAALVIKNDTGDIEVNEIFTFESANISVSTGDVGYAAKTNGEMRVKTSTGDISVQNTSVGALDLSVSTGKINVSSLACAGDVSIAVSTGKTHLKDLSCQSLQSTGDTGDLTLENVIAEAKITVKRSTGDVQFTSCDAAEVFVKTSTGDVRGTFLSDKIVFAETSTGKVDVPKSTVGGRCEIKTSTGDIKIEIKGN